MATETITETTFMEALDAAERGAWIRPTEGAYPWYAYDLGWCVVRGRRYVPWDDIPPRHYRGPWEVKEPEDGK